MVAGLGNPGPEYQETRHNVGFLVLEALAEELDLPWRRPLFPLFAPARYLYAHSGYGSGSILVKPLTYMNRSGTIFPGLMRKWSTCADEVLVVCDNMDLPPGQIRIKRGGGTAGHNGIKSLVEGIGSPGFCRLYVGIGRPVDGEVISHVLGVPGAEEAALLRKGADLAKDALARIVSGELLETVMNQYNRHQQDSHSGSS